METESILITISVFVVFVVFLLTLVMWGNAQARSDARWTFAWMILAIVGWVVAWVVGTGVGGGFWIGIIGSAVVVGSTRCILDAYTT